MADLGAAYFVGRRFDEAVPALRLVIQADPSLPLGYRFLAACLAQMGQLDEAREIVTRLRALPRS
jgi:Flp pilus assembly protein TadD